MLMLAAVVSLLQAPSVPITSAPTPAPVQRPTPCAAPVFREFDFWIGSWDVVDPQGKFVGTNRIERVGNCFLQENWAAARGGYTGRSLNSVGFDRKWHQTWTDSGGLRLELTGGLVGGKMVMEGETPSTDPKISTPTRNRITWSPEASGVVRQLWETSSDTGKTWTTAFDGRYHPASLAGPPLQGFFAKIAGAWIGSGSVGPRESHAELHVEQGVGQTARLHWRNVIVGASREVFEGSAVYEKKTEGEYAATWWDSQGSKYAISATGAADGSSLTAVWGDKGKTVYSLIEGGALEVVDSLKSADGTWTEFGRAKLSRQ